MFVSFDCCVLSGRVLCVGLITLPEESYRLWCVSECDREASIMRRPWPTGGCCAMEKKNLVQSVLISARHITLCLALKPKNLARFVQ
jgi:hypothetical protein